MIPKGCHDGASVDATAHQKTMQHMVSEKVMKIIKICFLNCKNMPVHCMGHEHLKVVQGGRANGRE
jgi:hypothetical protein